MSRMDRVYRALAGAMQNCFHPVVLGVLLVPMVGAALVWTGVTWWFWDSWTGAIEQMIVNVSSDGWIARFEPTRFAGAIAAFALILLVAPAILATSMLIAAVFAMPVLVEHVARRDYPDLERRKGGTVLGSAVNAVIGLSAFALLWLATLPFWLLVGPLAALIPWVLSAYLNQRLFRYDALSEHASSEEMKRIFDERFSDLFVLGLATGLLYFVPMVNLVAPVFSALAFVSLGLDELARMRADEKVVTGETLTRDAQ